jgi:negative regulator of flagellin synthesis FlgM
MTMIDRIQKIYGIGSVEPVKRKGGRKSEGDGVGEGVRDGVEVSSFGREMSQALAELRKVPEVRTDKVETIRGQVERGEYRVDSSSLAARLIEAGLFGDLGE